MFQKTHSRSVILSGSGDGASARSPTLIYECALDENGTLVDENCKNRFEFTFNGNASIGLWNVSYMKSINGSVTETLYGSVNINEDVHLDGNHTHDEDAQSVTQNQDSGADSTTQLIAMAIAIVSAICLGLLLMQPDKKTLVEEE